MHATWNKVRNLEQNFNSNCEQIKLYLQENLVKMKNCYKIPKKSSMTLNICQTKGLGVSLQFLE